MNPSPLSVLAFPLLALGALAQEHATVPAPAAGTWRIPVHTLPADPRGGAYGTWAAGPDYKASFHDGFAFHPLLGPAFAEGLPLCWHTESVRVGGASLAAPTTTPSRQEAWRVEYRHGSVVEAYDLRGDGVEQTFTLLERPEATGDLVLRGRITTRLTATPRPPEHGNLTFRDGQGRPLVEYGAAFAVDAAGRRQRVATGFDGKAIQLVLDGAWLAEASFPVVVDPLLTRTVLSAGADAGATVTTTSIAANANPTRGVLTCCTRQFTATDVDAYAVQSTEGFAMLNPLFADVTTAWSTTRAQCTTEDSYSRWLIALQRDFGTLSAIRVYSHSTYDNTLNSGATVFLPGASGETWREPAIGSCRGNSYHALVVFQSDVTSSQANTNNTSVWGQLLDVQTAALLGTPFLLAPYPIGSQRDREHQCVSTLASDTEGWLVAFEELDRAIANDNWDLVVSRVSNAGAVVSTQTTLGNNLVAQHKLQPRIAGSEGHYLMSWLLSTSLASGGGSALQCRAIEWPTNGSPVTAPIRTLESDVNAVFRQGGLSFDTKTLSHWALAYSVTRAADAAVLVTRVGQSGGVTERQTVEQSATTAPGHASVTFHWRPNQEQFLVSHSTTDAAVPHPVVGLQFRYPAARNVYLGDGCVGAGSGFAAFPYAGSRFYYMGQSQAEPNAAGVGMIGWQPATASLAGIGMPGCTLRIQPTVFVPLTVSSSGYMFLYLPLPDAPLFVGDLYTQMVWVKPSANAAGLVAGPGGRIEVR